jgi:hypothetical protein
LSRTTLTDSGGRCRTTTRRSVPNASTPPPNTPTRVAGDWTLASSVLFDAPTIHRHLFEVTFTADQYALNLSTQSGIKEFPPAERAELIDRIRRRVNNRGGTVTANLLAVLTVAKRRRR